MAKTEHDIGIHLDETAITVVSKPGIIGAGRETFHGLIG